MAETVTVISYNRPLTHGARKELQDYGVIDETAVNDFGHWTEVELETEPPEEVLERHELRIDREPKAVFATDTGERVEVFEDTVEVNGMEQSISPEDAIEHAEANGWERVEG